MGSYQVVDVSQVEARNGIFRALTDQLGVAGFRINQLELPAGAEGLEHDHIGNDRPGVDVDRNRLGHRLDDKPHRLPRRPDGEVGLSTFNRNVL